MEGCSGVVHDAVDTRSLARRFGEQRLDPVVSRQIRTDGQALRAECFHFSLHVGCGIVVARVAQDQPVTVGGQSEGACPADSASSAGDDDRSLPHVIKPSQRASRLRVTRSQLKVTRSCVSAANRWPG